MFRDCYQYLREFGFALYGLSTDSVAANRKFQLAHGLPYNLLCDEKALLIRALGFGKPPKETVRGAIAIDKDGQVLTVVAGPFDATVRAMLDFVGPQIEASSVAGHP